MTLEEKLERFRDAAINNAREESEKVFLEYKSAIEEEYEAHKKEKNVEIELELQAEMAGAKRELNREMLSKDLEYKKEISKKEKEIKDKLFEDVEKAVLKRKTEDDYIDYLCEKIENAKDFAAGDEMIIYIDPSDKEYLSEIIERTKVTPQISTMNFFGGIRAVIRSKNILIDDSYKTFIDEAKSEFVFKDFEV
jgi:vacuolar-type H+-ATPase subunit E/Vma4